MLILLYLKLNFTLYSESSIQNMQYGCSFKNAHNYATDISNQTSNYETNSMFANEFD